MVNLLRSGVIETFFESLPRAGGVVAIEFANNAAAGGKLIPTMVLGVPGDGSFAVLMSADAVRLLSWSGTVRTEP